ncbi:Protein ycgM, putative [Perkinsus marinus ATCC 50983]|uniref:Protein ycgM, putative n=1 Tax=Perkinsus marinus (strain ATCC 50983 / TXsc) TaxID=423536 RepID=C5KEB0_PERM5|nr:Protein ycgM, putative [Perkinsus marinus ATCC 50983]EER17184.1 Protein ycgM, putative [Perkinsus marinus ATCC 50983]|eukprot:XP_002785388.1 Protein ycgM, putative [Perkinsus marinus ATCC 50983]
MSADPTREPPFYFMKPSDAVTPPPGDGQAVLKLPYPRGPTGLVHHEGELVVCLGPGASNEMTLCQDDDDNQLIQECVFGYALGVDLTKRDIQAKAKSMRRPWEESKSFDNSAPISAVYPLRDSLPWETALLRLKVNGEVRQESTLDKMIWPVADIIRYIAQRNEIAAGDLIFTGTPAGVGPLSIGDLCEVELVQKDDPTVPILPGAKCSLQFT